VQGGGAGRRVYGHFTTFIAQGIQGGSTASADLGVRVVALVE
jgi:hypothetical protein